MKNIKIWVCLLICGISVSFFYTYVVNINQYKSISQLNIANNDVVKSFLVNEEEYNKIINENIKCIGNNKLHKLKLNDKQKRHVKHNLEKYVGNRFLEETLSDEKKKYNKNNINVYRNITYSMYINRGFFKFIERLFIKQFDIDGTIKKVVNDVYSEACYFPVAVMESNKGSYPFGNTWMGARNYGGNRKHEGTDIMYTENKEDVVPIVSVSDGIVDKKGWLELGGYRVLIKTDRNVKFYYAHLSSYAKGIEEGVKVKAGQLLGYMGSTGYGKEGTKGKFDVHLHFGMYYKDSKSGKDVGLNPYFLLKLLNSNKLYYK